MTPCPQPAGGFYVYPGFAPWREALAHNHNVHTGQDLANFLLDETHMAVLPGSEFGAGPQDLTLRLATSYLYAFSDEEGETVLETFDRSLSPQQFLKAACPKVIEVRNRFEALINSLS